MGEGAGPCGPCTEIFWDTQNDDLGEDRWLEIWNLVFMQHYRNDQGQLENLPIVCVDTGMGLERLASVVQSKENNYETDAFGPMFDGLHKIMTDAGIEVYSLLSNYGDVACKLNRTDKWFSLLFFFESI